MRISLSQVAGLAVVTDHVHTLISLGLLVGMYHKAASSISLAELQRTLGLTEVFSEAHACRVAGGRAATAMLSFARVPPFDLIRMSLGMQLYRPLTQEVHINTNLPAHA